MIKFFTSDDLFVQFQDQYDAMETQVEEMLKNTSGLESVMKSQDNRNAEDELSENVEGGAAGESRWRRSESDTAVKIRRCLNI